MRRSEFERGRAALILILAIALVAAVAPIVMAQEASANITGRIQDPSGASVAGAAVTARDVDRGSVFKTETNVEGAYNLPRLPIGRYELRVEAAGFQTAVRSAFDLVLNQTASIDITMTIGPVSQQMEISASAPVLQTQTTEISTVMEARAIASLPLQTRNYNQLALLIPGALTISPASFNTGQKTFNAARPNINGNREQANYYVLDGVDNNEFVDNNVAYSPSVDAIQEFNVITNNPSAEFGHFLGGVINVSLKSGTNQFHGNLFEYLRNDFFNANEWSNNFNGLPTARQRWNEFGGTIGGPVRKDKLFFFADYQGSRFDLPATPSPLTTFTAQNVSGNLSDLGVALHYPGTNVAMPSDLTKATICGAGQTFGSSPCIKGLSPAALKIAGALPKPNLPGTPGSNGTTANLNNLQQQYTHGNQGDIKMDWNASDRDRVFARYSQQHVERPIVNSEVFQYSGNGSGIFPLQSAVVGYTRTISSRLVNDFRAGMNYYPAEDNAQALTTTAGAGLIPGQPTQYLPGLSFASSKLGGQLNGPFAFGTTYSPEVFHQTSMQASDTAIFTKNAHTLRMGVQWMRYRNNYIPATSSDGAAGQIGFNGTYTGYSEGRFLPRPAVIYGIRIGIRGHRGPAQQRHRRVRAG